MLKARDTCMFTWSDLGDPAAGRPNLGQEVPVLVYRLLQYTIRDMLILELGPEKSTEIFRNAGKQAGIHFCKNVLDTTLGFSEFISQAQRVLKELKIGLLRVEEADLDKQEFIVTVAEDLDCSGLPVSDEHVCEYDEGFLAGVMEAYTGKPFIVREVDCWASGDRVCRFTIKAGDERHAL